MTASDCLGVRLSPDRGDFFPASMFGCSWPWMLEWRRSILLADLGCWCSLLGLPSFSFTLLWLNRETDTKFFCCILPYTGQGPARSVSWMLFPVRVRVRSQLGRIHDCYLLQWKLKVWLLISLLSTEVKFTNKRKTRDRSEGPLDNLQLRPLWSESKYQLI